MVEASIVKNKRWQNRPKNDECFKAQATIILFNKKRKNIYPLRSLARDLSNCRTKFCPFGFAWKDDANVNDNDEDAAEGDVQDRLKMTFSMQTEL